MDLDVKLQSSGFGMHLAIRSTRAPLKMQPLLGPCRLCLPSLVVDHAVRVLARCWLSNSVETQTSSQVAWLMVILRVPFLHLPDGV